MNLKRLIILLIILGITSVSKAQFFTEYNIGYSFSLNNFGDGTQINNPLPEKSTETILNKHPLLYYKNDKDILTINPAIGSGINNEITFGYKRCFFAIKLALGMNVNALNFKNNKNNFTYSDIKTHTDANSPEIPWYWRAGFNEYLTTEYQYSLDFIYNLYYINPAISFFYDYKKFTFGASTGISFNFIDFLVNGKVSATAYNDTYNNSLTYSSTLLLSPEQKMVDELFYTAKEVDNFVISYTLSLDCAYKINDNLELVGNIKFRPVFYTPLVAINTDRLREGNNNGVLSEYEYDETPVGFSYNTFIDTETKYWFEARNYNFSTIGISLGIKYIFGKSQPNEN
ncbi:MAG: hypothetical protein RBR97_17870 [Bacteroidales bacterium]|nr:hypothetical protein [Bacteroidales bacterium]